MTEKRDYYDVLGINRQATDEDIKKSYRKLAFQYHPDRNKDKSAEEKFKEVNQAYEILSDPQKRANYDRFGHAGIDGGFVTDIGECELTEGDFIRQQIGE